MTNYRVTIWRSQAASVEVEANTQEEAMDLAELAENPDWHSMNDVEVSDIEKIHTEGKQ